MSSIRTSNASAVTGLPADALLPGALHELAARWRELDTALDDLEAASMTAEAAIPAASEADRQALVDAVASGAELPPEGAHEAEARRQLREIDTRFAATEGLFVAHSRKVAAAMLAHRDEIAELTRPHAAAALDAYRRATAKAASALTEAKTTLSAALAPLAMLDELARHEIGVGGLPVPLASQPLDAAEQNAKTAAKIIDASVKPPSDAKFLLRAVGGTTAVPVEAQQAYGFIAAGDYELVDPDDEDRLVRALNASHPPTWWARRGQRTIGANARLR